MIDISDPEIDDEATNSRDSRGGETAEATRPRSYASEDDDPPISPDDPPDPPWSRKELEELLPLRSSDPDKETWESTTGTSADTAERYHAAFIRQPSPGRRGMLRKHVLMGRDGKLPRSKV